MENPEERNRKTSAHSKTSGHSKSKNRSKVHVSRECLEEAVTLLDCAYDGNFEKLRRILFSKDEKTKNKRAFLVNCKDKDGIPLVCKCIQGVATSKDEERFAECVRLLASADVPLDAQDRFGRTAIHWCVQYDKFDVLTELLSSGARIDVFDNEGFSPLHLAIARRSEACVDFLCGCVPPQLLEAFDGYGRSPLFLALSTNAGRIFQCLLFAGSNPDGVGPDGRQLIIHTIERGQGKLTELLLKHRASLSTGDPDGFTGIHLAACQENPESTFVLANLVKKAALCVKDQLGRTPLMYATLMGFDKNVELLLRRQIDILDRDNEGKTALHLTSSNTYPGCVELLCRYDPNIINAVDSQGHTPAHDAVSSSNVLVLRTLLEEGADLNVKDHEGHSLVHWAAAYCSPECFEELVKYDPSLDERDVHGASPVHYASQFENNKDVDRKRLEILRRLIELEASFECTDNEGRRPLHWAASSGNPSALELLVEAGAEINVATSQEKLTALHLASSQGHKDCVDILSRQSDTAVDQPDGTGCTPLFYACATDQVETARILLDADANPDCNSKDGKSSAHCAASQGALKCLELLNTYDADLEAKNDQTDTPLHEAASAGQEACVLFLLDNNCNINVQNSSGATPLHYSVAEGHNDLTKRLLQRGAIVNSLVTTNETEYISPLDVALGNGDHSSIELLQRFGARTGHSIVQNAANAIQHQWRRYKKHHSTSTASSRRSTFSESISVRDERCREEASLKENSDDISFPEGYDDTQTTASIDREDNETGTSNLDSLTNGRIGKDLAEAILKQIARGKEECNRMHQLMQYAEGLSRRARKVAQDAEDLVNSNEFKAVKEFNDRANEIEKSYESGVILPKIQEKYGATHQPREVNTRRPTRLEKLKQS